MNDARTRAAGSHLEAGGAGESRPPRPPATGEGDGDEGQPRIRDRRQAVKHAIVLALSLAAIALTVRAILGERGLLDAHRSSGELLVLRSEVETWRSRNTYLEGRIRALRTDPATIEKIARERLGWVRPGEITFLFPHDPALVEPGDPGPVPPGEFAPTQPGDVIEPSEPPESSEPSEPSKPAVPPPASR